MVDRLGGDMARPIRYITQLPGKKSREREVAELVARLEDPDDPYRGACWATGDDDQLGRDD